MHARFIESGPFEGTARRKKQEEYQGRNQREEFVIRYAGKEVRIYVQMTPVIFDTLCQRGIVLS